MKRRGLRKYFKNLKNQKLPEFLDFSGSEHSWFDLYHLHIDNSGLGNRSWKSRKQHLEALFDLAAKVEEKLQDYPKKYQYWIQIDERDSMDDAIYIHTQNPNRSNFPVRFHFDNKVEPRNPLLQKYLEEKEYKTERMKLNAADGQTSLAYILVKDIKQVRIK